jgi:hypothetical protein
MSRLFESFELLDQRWDARALKYQSVRTVFLWLLPLLFLLGAEALAEAYDVFRLHRFDWSLAFSFPVIGSIAFGYARIIYRRLPR